VLKGPLHRNLGEIAIDGYGSIDVSRFNGWSIWQVAPNGTATQVGMASEARQSGGDTPLQSERGMVNAVPTQVPANRCVPR
jgi:hypothetical protein